MPRGEKEEIEAMLDAARYAVDNVATIPRVPSLATVERHFTEADELFRTYGLHACATDATGMKLPPGAIRDRL